MPVRFFIAAAAGTSGDRGRLLGAAGDGGLFLGFGVLRSGAEVKYEQETEEHEKAERESKGGKWHLKGNEVPSVLHKNP